MRGVFAKVHLQRNVDDLTHMIIADLKLWKLAGGTGVAATCE